MNPASQAARPITRGALQPCARRSRTPVSRFDLLSFRTCPEPPTQTEPRRLGEPAVAARSGIPKLVMLGGSRRTRTTRLLFNLRARTTARVDESLAAERVERLYINVTALALARGRTIRHEAQ